MTETNETSRRTATLRCQFCLTLNRVDLARAADRPKCGSCGKPMLLDRPVKITDAEFGQVIGESDVPILVDFHADWCGPCKQMAPVLDDLARDHVGELLVAKLDTDRNPSTAERFGVKSIPTLILFRNGEEVGRETGAVPRDRLDALVSTAA